MAFPISLGGEMSMSPRYCGSCGAALTPRGRFCGACGAAAAGAPPQPAAASPPPQPAAPAAPSSAAAPPYFAAPALPPTAAPRQPYQPAPTPQPAYGHADWNSLEVQPGETALGSWVVALIVNGLADVTGSLAVTDRRVLFKPQIAGRTPLVMVISQLDDFKDRHALALSKDQVARVHSEKGLVNTRVFVTMADGAVHGFVRGLMSADPILAAIRQR